ncbi:MAG: hypothetical protein V4582_08880 [Pseudomonadota bacterium]
MSKLSIARGRCGAALLASALAGCAGTTPHWDAHFGQALRQAQASQIANAGAPANLDPVAGIDGQAARAAQERYERSFREPAPQPDALTIGISKK